MQAGSLQPRHALHTQNEGQGFRDKGLGLADHGFVIACCYSPLGTQNSKLAAPRHKQDLHIQFASNSHPFVILKELIAARMRGKGSSVGGRMR